MTDRALSHPWLRIERLIRSILEVRPDPITRPVMKATLRDAIKEREKIEYAGWFKLTSVDHDGRSPPRSAPAALAAVLVRHRAPELAIVHALLDSWRGIGLVVVGMECHGYRVALTKLTEGEWRTVFSSDPLTSADGVAVARTSWRSVQMAAWGRW